MRIPQRVRRNTGLVSAIVLVASAVGVFLVQGVPDSAEELAEVDVPLQRAALEMEIRAGEIVRAVLS